MTSETELIPAPTAVEGPTRCGFAVEADTALWGEPGTEGTQRWLRSTLGAALGLPLPPGEEGARNTVALRLDGTLPAEAYRLEVTATWGVVITGGGPAGVFWGAQTLRQLLGPAAFRRAPVRPGMTYGVPSQAIDDAPPFPLARPHARRGPALHAQGRRPALPGSDGGAQTQRLPLPLDGRPGLARTDRAVPEADRDRVLAGAHEIRPPCLTALGRQAARRLLHPGRHPRDRRLRRRAAYHRGPGNRRTGTLAGRHRRVSGTRQHRRHRHQLPLRLGHLGINPNVLAPTDNTLRFYEGVFEELLELFPGSSFTSAATNASRTSGSSRRPRRRASRNSVSRTRTSCSRGSSDTSTSGSPRAGEGSSAGTRSWRAGSRTAPSCRRGAATRAGSPRPARATTSSCALSSTCTWTGGRPRRGRAGADRPCAHPGGRLSLRAGSRAAHRGRGRSCAGRAGQRVDRGDGGSRTRGLSDFPRLAAFAEVAWSALPAPAERDFADFERRMAAHYPRLDALGSPTVRPPDPCRGSAAPESSDAPRTARPRTPRNPGERLEHGREKGPESHR